jgi:hypothetical protein
MDGAPLTELPGEPERGEQQPPCGRACRRPLHYGDAERAIDALALDPYLGPCRVIHAIGCGPLIRPEHLAHAAAELPPRVLVRTAQRADRSWRDDFSAYAPETLAWLAARGVRLVGIDTASVDPADSKTLDATGNCCITTCACWKTWCSTKCPRATTNSSPCRCAGSVPAPRRCAPSFGS